MIKSKTSTNREIEQLFGSPLLIGKNILCSNQLTMSEINKIYDLSVKMRNLRRSNIMSELFKNKILAMIFHSPSMRTRMSFESTFRECGGSAIYFTPNMGRLKNEHLDKNMQGVGESIKDFAMVTSLYVSAIAIRIMEAEVCSYGQGNRYLEEMCKYASVPIVSMADDKYHPCQGLAEFMTLQEHFNINSNPCNSSLKGKRYLLTWAKGNMARGWNSIQESLTLAAMSGMDIRIARPEGYDLDPNIYQFIQEKVNKNNSTFEITDSLSNAYDDVDVICSRNWHSSNAYSGGVFNKEPEILKAHSHDDWFLDDSKMKKTRKGVFVHPMPIERGMEVSDSVVDGQQSLVYRIAENKLHIQKALFYHLLGYS